MDHTENPSTENPSTENPSTENPSTENPNTENVFLDFLKPNSHQTIFLSDGPRRPPTAADGPRH